MTQPASVDPAILSPATQTPRHTPRKVRNQCAGGGTGQSATRVPSKRVTTVGGGFLFPLFPFTTFGHCFAICAMYVYYVYDENP